MGSDGAFQLLGLLAIRVISDGRRRLRMLSVGVMKVRWLLSQRDDDQPKSHRSALRVEVMHLELPLPRQILRLCSFAGIALTSPMNGQ